LIAQKTSVTSGTLLNRSSTVVFRFVLDASPGAGVDARVKRPGSILRHRDRSHRVGGKEVPERN
jgi:hypothetical protein